MNNWATPWINDEIQALIRTKINFRYKNCIHKWKDTVLNKEYRVICKLVKSEVKRFRLIHEQDIVDRAKKEPEILYKYLNSQQAVKESIRVVKNSDCELTQDRMEIANLLTCVFGVFVIEDERNITIFWSQRKFESFWRSQTGRY